MNGEAMERLLDYDRRRYWLVSGWCLRFRVKRCPITDARPHGIRYAFTLHDVDMTRLLGFDNAHGVPRRQAYDHRHRFRRVADLISYQFVGTDELICDFFDESRTRLPPGRRALRIRLGSDRTGRGAGP
jgi:hypothetical protein